MSDPYLGEVRLVAFNFAPVGWQLCEGQLLPISSNQALFAILGTTYGGDGETTFALPDFRGRAPVHEAITFALGSTGGQERVTLTAANLPAGNLVVGGDDAAAPLSLSGGRPGVSSVSPYGSGASVDMHADAVSTYTGGGGASHENMPPFVALNYIIATSGIFPS